MDTKTNLPKRSIKQSDLLPDEVKTQKMLENIRLQSGEASSKSPYVAVIVSHNKKKSDEASYIVMFIQPAIEDNAFKFNYLRMVRLTQDEYLDWYNLVTSLVSRNLIAQCNIL